MKIKFTDFGRCLVCLHNPCDCKKKKLCKCGHGELEHNFGGTGACYVDMNEDGCLEFKVKE